jgi:uncharacterized protein (TIGR02246 family)
MRFPALLLLLGLAACGSRQIAGTSGPEPADVPEDMAQAIGGAIEQYRQAYEVHSVEALAGLYTRDLDLTLIYQGRRHQGWTQVESFLSARLEGATKVRMVIKELTVQPLGAEAAVASASLETTIGDDSTTVTENGALTLVFRNIAGKWMVVAEHFSYPPRAS